MEVQRTHPGHDGSTEVTEVTSSDDTRTTPPAPQQTEKKTPLNPLVVIAGALAAIVASAAVIRVTGADQALAVHSAAQAASHAAHNITQAASHSLGPAAASVLPAVAAVVQNVWAAVIAPMAEVPQAMFMGWQHCWLVMTAHPSFAALQHPPGWLADLTAIVPWQLVAALAAAAVAAWSIRRHVEQEKAAIK